MSIQRPIAGIEANPAPGFQSHPEHTITVSPFNGEVTVEFDGKRIAQSTKAVELYEANHAPAIYLPMGDVDQALLRHSSHTTHCPFKGDASYWDIVIGDHEIDNAVWAYETPYDEMLELAGLVAFYPNKVKITASPA
ncbi:MAG: DUF427 domain-containing protein [Salaquimonas sp.]|jgi:uncharacterized protein (DUF427 family)|nr:DUF427 domain-containing protein [Salaquimonas sp.]